MPQFPHFQDIAQAHFTVRRLERSYGKERVRAQYESIRDAFAALKLGNVTVEERGLLVDQKGMMPNPYFFDPQPNSRTKTEVQLTRKLIVKGSELRKMDEEALLQLTAKLLDVAQDAGARVGPQNNAYYYYRWGMNPSMRGWPSWA